MTETSMLHRINALRQMSVGELQAEWERLYGTTSRSRNKQFLFRRLAWRTQELAQGGLSRTALQRIDELAPETFQRARTPAHVAPPDAPVATTTKRDAVRDIRMPSPGTVLTRAYKGREIRVAVLADGVEWEGRHYRSLSAVARAVTGQKWNGWLFFGLTKRKRC